MLEGLLQGQDFITAPEEAALIAEIGKLPLEEAKHDEIRWRWQHSIAPTPELRDSITLRTRR